jgi:hypothetical protein
MYQITHLVYACPISITTAVFSPAARLSINDAINKNLKKEKIGVLITKQQAKLKVNMSIYRHLNIQYRDLDYQQYSSSQTPKLSKSISNHLRNSNKEKTFDNQQKTIR